MKRFFAAAGLISILFFIAVPLLASGGSGFSYENDPLQISVRFGYRYPAGNVSTLGGNVNFKETQAKNIFKPGVAYGLNIGYVFYPLIISYNMEGGMLPYTSQGHDYAMQRNPKWHSVSSDYITFEGLIGGYFYNNGITSLYAGLSFGLIDMRFSSGSLTTNHYYNESAAVLGIQLRPVHESRDVFLIVNLRYQMYIEKKVLPHDVTLSAGIGYNTGL